jgi:hypothetical protein
MPVDEAISTPRLPAKQQFVFRRKIVRPEIQAHKPATLRFADSLRGIDTPEDIRGRRSPVYCVIHNVKQRDL